MLLWVRSGGSDNQVVGLEFAHRQELQRRVLFTHAPSAELLIRPE